MFVHIDGDIIKYRAGFAAEKGEYILTYIRGGDEVYEAYTYKKDVMARIENLKKMGAEVQGYQFTRRPEPVENALHNVKTTVNKIVEALEPDEFVVYLSGKGNFREDIATIRPYKGNRDPTHKPVHGDAIVEYISKTYPTVVSEDEEADDVIGYTHYAMWESDSYSSVIASTDKDLDMIPGLHYNFVKEEMYDVDEDTALHFFYTQLLTGDSVDNIAGVSGIGPQKAAKLLKGCEDELSMYNVVEAAYDEASNFVNDPQEGYRNLLENARLLWIRRREGEVWCPLFLR